MTASLDTNVLLRFALGDVPEQFTKAYDLLNQPGASFVVVDVAWVEMAFALERHYHLARVAIVDIITSLMSIDVVTTHEKLITDTCTMYLNHPKLSFNDCYLGSAAEGAGATPLFTFDEKLAHQHDCAELVP
jgi:predicted nucleic-acid-binding protein